MYSQTIIYYKAVLLATFPATTAITAITVTTANTATIVITAITATTVIGPPTNLSTVVTFVTALLTAVSIFLKKPLKNRPANGMTWHFHCGHLNKEAFESMVKRIIGDEIEALTILQCLDCV